MTVVLRPAADTTSIESVAAGLFRAWNAGDALAFAGFFSEDADLVNIHGMHLRGRQAIAGVYQLLFRSVFADSIAEGGISFIRKLRPGVAMVHLKIDLTVGSGALAGLQHIATSLAMVQEGSEWKIGPMHNTLVSASQV